MQQDLAATLQYMADQEATQADGGRVHSIRAAYDAFYKGDIARTITDFHREHGGLLRMSDMNEFWLVSKICGWIWARVKRQVYDTRRFPWLCRF